jgi:hypothetical protein
MLQFEVIFKEIKQNGEPKKLKIFSQDHARATEWALIQLDKWGMKKSPFEVSEFIEPPPPAPAKKAEKPKKEKAK